jgi:hypothetical protein
MDSNNRYCGETSRFKKSLSKWALLLLSFTPIFSSAATFSAASIKEIAHAYGFVLGQEYTLDLIARQHPDFDLRVTLARAQFSATLPNISSKLEAQLKEALGPKGFEELGKTIQSNLYETLSKQRLSRDDALGFFEQIKARSKGEIESPVLENLLAVNYMRNPVGEFADGYRQRFQTDGSVKAQGIKLKLQLPKSWIAKDGERPHIVQKWTSRSSNAVQMIHLDIRDGEGYAPSKSDMEKFVKSGEVKDAVAEGATYVDSGNFTLEKQTGYWLQMNLSQERAGRKLYQESVMYQLFFRGKAIGIMCAALSPDDEREKAVEAFKQMRPVCQQVLNSLVLLQAY